MNDLEMTIERVNLTPREMTEDEADKAALAELDRALYLKQLRPTSAEVETKVQALLETALANVPI